MRFVVFILFAWILPLRLAAAAEPSVVLTTSDEILVYALEGDKAELRERRTSTNPLPDETPQARTLDELPDGERLMTAYLNSFLDCGRKNEAALMQRWVQQQTASPEQVAQRLAGLQALPLKQGHVLVWARGGNKAMLLQRRSGRRLAGTPCGAANRYFRVSPNRQRVALVSEDVKEIDFSVSGQNVSWEGEYADTMTVHLVDLAAPGKPVAIGGDEEPFDILLPDEGEWRLLSAQHGTNWWNPMNWLAVIGGHADRRSNVYLKTYDAAGTPRMVQKIASHVGLVQARFVTGESP